MRRETYTIKPIIPNAKISPTRILPVAIPKYIGTQHRYNTLNQSGVKKTKTISNTIKPKKYARPVIILFPIRIFVHEPRLALVSKLRVDFFGHTTHFFIIH
jgi:hypothetical protein